MLNYFNLSTLLIAVVVFLLVFWFVRQPRNLPPGPKGWPLIGYLPQLLLSGEEPHETISRFHASYGNIVSVNLAGKLIVFLSGHQVIKEAFSQPRLSGRPHLYITEKFGSDGIGLINSSGDSWKEIRRFCTLILKGFGVGKSRFEENIAKEARCLIDEVVELRGKPFDPYHLFGVAVSNVTMSIVLGKRFKYSDLKFQRFLTVQSELVVGERIEFSSIVSSLTFLPFVKDYIILLNEFFKYLTAFLLEARLNYDASAPKSFFDFNYKETESNNRPTSITKENLVHMCGDLIIAGSETTSTTLRWSLLYLMAYPGVQKQIHAELDNVTCRNRFPRLSDKPDLPYTQAVICEVQRIATIAPMALPHSATENMLLHGYYIPKDTIVICNLRGNHFDPSIWEDPQEFRPERFLKDGKLISNEHFTPFGIGLRICPGEQLARMELFVFLTLLLHQFTFKKPQDAPPITFKGISGATWAPAGFQVCAVPRE